MCAERLAVYTTAYPGVEPWLRPWHESVLGQTDREFDLWVGLDAIGPDAARAAFGRPTAARWLPAPHGATPAEIRSAALERLTVEYAAVICVDSDDVLEPARVSAARRALANADVAACALRLVDAGGRDLAITFGPPAGADPAALLPRYNVFGLSNSAYRSATLARCLPLPPDCVLMDWLLATRAWAHGARLTFDGQPQMRYRQHAANVAPMVSPFTAEQVRQATARVLGHYRLLLDGEWPLPARARELLAPERARVTAFGEATDRQPSLLDSYVRALNRLPPLRVWWWQVAHPALEALWSH